MQTAELREIVERGAPGQQVGEGLPFSAHVPSRGQSELDARVAAWLSAATGQRPGQEDFVLQSVGGRDRLQERLSDARLREDREPPNWVTALDDFLQALPANASELQALGSPGAPEADEWRPDPDQDPLAAVWNGALKAALSLLPEAPGRRIRLSFAARTDLAVSLVGRVLAVVTRALDPELHAAKALGLTGVDAIGGDREAWLQRLSDVPGLVYPLGVAVDNWRTSTQVMLTRLHTDCDLIAQTLLPGPVSGLIARMAPDAGDPHEGGQSVCIIRFDTGARAVYKPKPQQGPAAWQQLLRALADSDALRAACVELATRSVLVRDDYGWDAFAESDEQATADEAATRRWLLSYGALCRLLEVLEAADMWFDNLITSGGLPQFIDVETMLQPKPSGMTPAQRMLAGTSAPTGAVSMPLPLPDGEVEDIGGLRPVGPVRLPFTEKVMGQLSTRVEGYDSAGVMRWTPPRWRPDFAATVDPREPLLAGYRAVDAAMAEGPTRAQVLAALDALARAPSRVVLRSTFVCYVLMRESLRTEVLTSGWAREVALASFLAPAAAIREAPSPTPNERLAEQMLAVGSADLAVIRDLDIPLVRHDPTSEALSLDGQQWHEGWFEGAPLARARQHLVQPALRQLRERVLSALASAALSAGTSQAASARQRTRDDLVAALVDAGIGESEAAAAVDAIRA